MPTGAGLRPGAKAPEEPPDPTDSAPALDPTDERRLETESRRGVRHRHRRKSPGTVTPCAYHHRASRRLYDICDPKIVASVGLGMDIVGIVLLFCFGAIGGEWINRGRLVIASNANQERIERNKCLARTGSCAGLGFAVTGFLLQIVAQWLP